MAYIPMPKGRGFTPRLVNLTSAALRWPENFFVKLMISRFILYVSVVEYLMEGFAPFCLVCCFVVTQLYHKIERISFLFCPSLLVYLPFPSEFAVCPISTETQGKSAFIFLALMLY